MNSSFILLLVLYRFEVKATVTCRDAFHFCVSKLFWLQQSLFVDLAALLNWLNSPTHTRTVMHRWITPTLETEPEPTQKSGSSEVCKKQHSGVLYLLFAEKHWSVSGPTTGCPIAGEKAHSSTRPPPDVEWKREAYQEERQERVKRKRVRRRVKFCPDWEPTTQILSAFLTFLVLLPRVFLLFQTQITVNQNKHVGIYFSKFPLDSYIFSL